MRMYKRISVLLFVLAQVFFSLTVCAEQRQASTWYGVERIVRPYYMDPSMTPSYQSVTYYLQGDTAFNDTVYKALYRNSGEYCAGLRTTNEGTKVYIRPTRTMLKDPWWDNTKTEFLLYDFDVEVGDTIYAFDASYVGIDNMGEDLSIQYRWIVQNTSTIDGRRHVVVKGGQSGHQVEWIEGIGTKHVLFENIYEDALDKAHSTYALCAADSEGNILYSYDTDDLGIRNNNCEWEYINSSVKSTYIYFEDKNGLRDSLEISLGLTDEEIDAIPTYSKDQVNQAAENGERWVFITKDVLDYDYVAFRTVYVYEPYNMPIWFGQRRIFVPIDRLPITIRWNKQFFVENDLLGSFLSDWVTGMPDVGGDYEIASARLINYESCSFSYTYVGDLNAYYPGSSYDKLDGNVIYKMIDLYLGTQRNLDQDLRTAEESLSPATKRIVDGVLMIEKNGRTYNAQGAEVK